MNMFLKKKLDTISKKRIVTSPFGCNSQFSPKKRKNLCVTRQYESKRPLRIILRSLNWILARIFLLHLTVQRWTNFNKFSSLATLDFTLDIFFFCHEAYVNFMSSFASCLQHISSLPLASIVIPTKLSFKLFFISRNDIELFSNLFDYIFCAIFGNFPW